MIITVIHVANAVPIIYTILSLRSILMFTSNENKLKAFISVLVFHCTLHAEFVSYWGKNSTDMLYALVYICVSYFAFAVHIGLPYASTRDIDVAYWLIPRFYLLVHFLIWCKSDNQYEYLKYLVLMMIPVFCYPTVDFYNPKDKEEEEREERKRKGQPVGYVYYDVWEETVFNEKSKYDPLEPRFIEVYKTVCEAVY